jgi:hypothetical protein
VGNIGVWKTPLCSNVNMNLLHWVLSEVGSSVDEVLSSLGEASFRSIIMCVGEVVVGYCQSLKLTFMCQHHSMGEAFVLKYRILFGKGLKVILNYWISILYK